MKLNFLLLSSLIFFSSAHSQDFTGQWKGGFTDKSTSFNGFGGDQCDYILELECKGTTVSGSSYTYFTDGGKKYYTICRLQGFIDRKQKYIEVKEVERTKTNVPVTVRNCFQTHKLTLFQHADTSLLQGKWVPAPGQDGDCGFGTTVLTRRELKQSYPGFNSASTRTLPAKKNVPKKIPANSLATTKNNPSNRGSANNKKPSPKQPQNNVAKKDIVRADSQITIARSLPESIAAPQLKFEKRNNTVLKTVQVTNKTVRVDLYDNGEIDGDSISLFYNGQLLMSSKRLSDKPITLNINVEEDMSNELMMYAENLGSIPPNTAVMVITDGAKRYEVRITSDLQKSGVINFVHKPANAVK